MKNSVAHWCISLDRRADRRFVMQRTMPLFLRPRMEFFRALDGDSIPQWKAEARFPGLKPSAWAVRLTKILALREFLRSDHDFLCLYEDDVIFAEEFEEVQARALDLAKPWDCVFLGGNHAESPLGDGDLLRCRATHNNHCLLVSREGAKKIRSVLVRTWTQGWSDREIEAAIGSGEIFAFCPRNFVAFQRAGASDNWEHLTAAPCLFAGDPWMPPDDAYVLFAACGPGDQVLEWGSGGSTVLLADRVGQEGKVTSIEHKREYHAHTAAKLAASGLDTRANLHLEPPCPERADDEGWRYLPAQMEGYVRAPLQFGIDEIDVAFVDGRERIACALVAARILKPGGFLLIHDFWGRERYRARLDELLRLFRYAFSTPQGGGTDPQGLAVFVRR